MAYCAYGGVSGDTKVADAEAVIDEVVRLLQACSFVKTNEVVKGGSLGHGTTVPGDFDADLVLYSSSITKEVMLNDGPGGQSGSARWWAQRLDNYLRSKLPGYDRKGTTEHGVQFTVTIQGMHGNWIKCDLLMSPWWDNQQQLLQYFSSQVARGNLQKTLKAFSASASKWQVQFIRGFPNEMKELIKRAKKWRNEQWPNRQSSDGRPKSYLMTVLVIYACWKHKEKLGCASYSDMVKRGDKGTLASSVAAIMRADVQNHHKFSISWDKQLKEYPSAAVPQGQPYILDPANPFNNMYLSGVGAYQPNQPFWEYAPGNGKWRPFAEKVHTMDLRA